MDQNINKDVLISVLVQQNNELKKLVQLQTRQLDNYKEHVEAYRIQVVGYKEKETISTRLVEILKSSVKSYEDQLDDALQTLEIQHKYIDELNATVEELKANAPGIAADK